LLFPCKSPFSFFRIFSLIHSSLHIIYSFPYKF
jgi:hypothetical protein